MKVTLIADPPMGDKVARRLAGLDGVDLNYVRGKHPQAVPPLPAGTTWVLAMNAGKSGVAIKEGARKAGARFVPLPPSWAAARLVLEQDGFFRTLRGVDALDTMLQGPGMMELDGKPALDAVRAQVKAAQAAKVGPLVSQRDVPPAAPRCEGPPKVVEVKRREVIVPMAASPDVVRERIAEIAAKGQPTVAPPAPGPAAPAPGIEAVAARRRAALRLAEQMFEANPEVSGIEVMNALRELLGVGVDGSDLYRLRRGIRAAHGLDPSGRSRSVHRSTLALGRAVARRDGLEAAHVPPLAAHHPSLAAHPGLAPQATGVLGPDSQAAIDLLCATLPRDGVRGLVVTFDANGAPHVEVELAVVRTETIAYTPKGGGTP